MTDHSIDAVIAALPLPVLLVGPDDRIRAANAPVGVLLGTDLLGKHFITVLRQPALLDAITAVRANAAHITTRYFSRDGAKDTTYRVVVARAGDDIVLSFEDQTASETEGQMRRDFVANVSHELRTPLTALQGFIETLRGAARDDPAARDRFLGIMIHEASRMTRLVDDLLSLSRVEANERVRPSGTVDMATLLETVLTALTPQAEAAGVTMGFVRPDDTELVPGDQGQLLQVFTNLVENGIKYGASGSEVTVTLHARARHPGLRGEGLRVVVADQGEGIAPHHIARLTERFYRVDNHRSREVGGTGLGLAIVKHIINRHRGRLLIESDEGQGTQVSVLLPAT